MLKHIAYTWRVICVKQYARYYVATVLGIKQIDSPPKCISLARSATDYQYIALPTETNFQSKRDLHAERKKYKRKVTFCKP